MINPIEFFEKYKKDFMFFGLLTVLFIVFSIIIGPAYGDIYVDSAREAYVPEMILKGKVLYKDIFILFPPFSYMFNALLYKIFGVKFGVIYAYSYFNAWLVMLGLYLICRVFIKEFYSFAFLFFVMCYYVLGNYFSQVCYIFPYAYAFPYATMFFQFALLAFLYYFKTGSVKLIYLFSILAGLAFSNKPEYFLCLIPVYCVMIIKKERFKSFAYSLVLVFLPAVTLFAILAHQGMTFSDFTNWLDFGRKFFATPEQMSINRMRISPPFDIENIKLLSYGVLITAAYFVINITEMFLLAKKNYTSVFALMFLPLVIIADIFGFESILYIDREFNFLSWQIQAAALICIVLAYRYRTKTPKEQMLCWLLIAGILMMTRLGFFPLFKLQYGIYVLVPLAGIWIFFAASNVNERIKKAAALALCLMGVTYSLSEEALILLRSLTVFKSDKGTMIAEHAYIDTMTDTINYIKENSKPDDIVLVLPEGAMVNHITGRMTNPRYYQLPPNHIKAIGEDKIVADLTRKKPEYMVLNDGCFWLYGTDFICKDFGFKICDFVEKNYTKVFESHVHFFSQRVYKRNEEN